MNEVDWKSFLVGVIWGLAIQAWLTVLDRLAQQQPPRPAPLDPFERERWDVLADARRIIDGEVIDGAAE